MLNRTAIYALKAVGYLALQNEGIFISSHHISREMQIPKDFLSKILNCLCLAGLIQSIRGKGGGFALATPASGIHLGDVVNLFEKVDDPRQCLLGVKKCDGSCGLHYRWRIISEQFQEILNNMTIDEINYHSCKSILLGASKRYYDTRSKFGS